MAIKSLISQRRQVKSTEVFQDLNYIDGGQGDRELPGNVHDVAIAEGTKYLEEDLNNIRSQLRDIIGKGTWYADNEGISLESLRVLTTTLETNISDLDTNSETLEQDLVTIANDLTNLGTEVTNLETTVTNLGTTVSDLDTNLSTDITNLGTDITNLSIEVTNLSADLIAKISYHNAQFHQVRNEDTIFEYLNEVLSGIVVFDPATDEVLKETLFTYDIDGVLQKINKSTWDDDIADYIRLEKNLTFIGDTLTEIQNRVI